MPSNTYYILNNISTFPMLIPIRDFCRQNKLQCGCTNTQHAVKYLLNNNYQVLQANQAVDNEIITILYKEYEYKSNIEDI